MLGTRPETDDDQERAVSLDCKGKGMHPWKGEGWGKERRKRWRSDCGEFVVGKVDGP